MLAIDIRCCARHSSPAGGSCLPDVRIPKARVSTPSPRWSPGRAGTRRSSRGTWRTSPTPRGRGSRRPRSDRCRRRCFCCFGSPGEGVLFAIPTVRGYSSPFYSSSLSSPLALSPHRRSGARCGRPRIVSPGARCVSMDIFIIFGLRLSRALKGCSCGSRGVLRGPNDGHNHRQGATTLSELRIPGSGFAGRHLQQHHFWTLSPLCSPAHKAPHNAM